MKKILHYSNIPFAKQSMGKTRQDGHDNPKANKQTLNITPYCSSDHDLTQDTSHCTSHSRKNPFISESRKPSALPNNSCEVFY
jgi:hypothetical protein